MNMRFNVYIPALVATIFIGAVFAVMPISLLHGGAATFGPLILGGESPIGPGSMTFAPELRIPSTRFYIGVAEKDVWCIFEECAPAGARVAALGGWLQGEDTEQWATREDFGLEGNNAVSSVVVVANERGKLVGIYPNKTVDNLEAILHTHRTLWQ
jgi:hypothetical protein